MDETKLAEIEQQIEESNPFKKKEVAMVLDKKEESSFAQDIVEKLYQQGMLATVKDNPDVQEKMLTKARESIELEVEKIISRGKKEAQDAAYDQSKDACKHYGIDDSVERWKIKLMVIGAGFWFIIWFIVSSITFTPISVFAEKINNFLKHYWLSLLIAIIVFGFIYIGIPLLIKYNLI